MHNPNHPSNSTAKGLHNIVYGFFLFLSVFFGIGILRGMLANTGFSNIISYICGALLLPSLFFAIITWHGIKELLREFPNSSSIKAVLVFLLLIPLLPILPLLEFAALFYRNPKANSSQIDTHASTNNSPQKSINLIGIIVFCVVMLLLAGLFLSLFNTAVSLPIIAQRMVVTGLIYGSVIWVLIRLDIMSEPDQTSSPLFNIISRFL